MPEQIIWGTELVDALEHVGFNVISSSSVGLVLVRLPVELRGVDATGLKGTTNINREGKRCGEYSWEIRMDWDETKGEHVNVIITTRRGTHRRAFVTMTEHQHDYRIAQGYGPPPSGLYARTIRNWSEDIGWRPKYYTDLKREGLEAQRAYKASCAEAGRARWLFLLRNRRS
jgi:hypothetical protein